MMSISRKAIQGSPEIGAKISASRRGIILNREQKENQKIALNRPDVKARMAEAKTKYRNIRCADPNRTGKDHVFETTRDVANWLKSIGYENARMSGVINCLTGRCKKYCGVKFELVI